MFPHWSDPPSCRLAPWRRELEEVVRLEDHVVELEEAQGLLAPEPRLDGLEGQHAVDAKVLADVAEELDVLEAVEPVGVVYEPRVARSVAENEEVLEDGADLGHVAIDGGVVQKPPRLVLAARVPDFCRAAADEDDGRVSVPLEQAEDHDLEQGSDVEGVGGRVEAEVRGHAAVRHAVVERSHVRALREVPARDELAEEGRFQGRGVDGLRSGAVWC